MGVVFGKNDAFGKLYKCFVVHIGGDEELINPPFSVPENCLWVFWIGENVDLGRQSGNSNIFYKGGFCKHNLGALLAFIKIGKNNVGFPSALIYQGVSVRGYLLAC